MTGEVASPLDRTLPVLKGKGVSLARPAEGETIREGAAEVAVVCESVVVAVGWGGSHTTTLFVCL